MVAARTVSAQAGVAPPPQVIFAAQPGPQHLLISCPVEDVLFGGARGGGKTFGLIGDWLRYEHAHGPHSRGIFFRRTYDELEEVQDRASKIFPHTGAYYRYGKRTWHWPSGAFLKMRYLERDVDAERYQGHSYTWMGVDELGNFASPKPIDLLRACLRSGDAPVPKLFRGSANPGGVGHSWIKLRYIDPAAPCTPFYDEESEVWRVYIPSRLEDNPALTENDPDYWKRVTAAAGGNEALLKAWRWGDWDIVAGGMFDDLFKRDAHIIAPFEIPESWYVDRAFDWGSSHPFSVGWWAQSDGTLAPNGRTYPRGTLFRVGEWYGWNGRANEGLRMLAPEIADGIIEREARLREFVKAPINPGPADTSIFDAGTIDNTKSLADVMGERGVYWTQADKSPGSRKTGWQRLREMMKAALAQPMESPGIFVFNTCTDGWIRTVPVLPRDKKNPDDVDTKAEDHPADETRYRVLCDRTIQLF